ncbi:hypothetical protein [Roseateles depolymerans]|uniref:Uncharacterized protein n=1 Tax=Roseateles depolymerans TaxID=76731 RepID=A0A0U3M9Q9_9BURK|nr:hypothetical protein [Roseateles depolymerans]ALV05357.1 hypothetical protein RD2015_861 [Roseateles depolymerans]REG14627.1 HNH/endonuclease VII toxin of polymorphic toxin system [Roseateles depolymerans]
MTRTALPGGRRGSTQRNRAGDTSSHGQHPRQAPKKQAASGTNTATFPYLDKLNLPPACKADSDRIHEKCDKDEGIQEGKDSFGKARTNEAQHKPGSLVHRMQGTFRGALRAIDGVGRRASGYKQNSKNQWMDNHCTGLWNKPGGGEGGSNIKRFEDQIADAMKNEKDIVEKAKAEAMDKLQNFAKDYYKEHLNDTLGAAAEKAAKRAAMSRFPTLMAVVGRVSAYEGLGKLMGNVAGAIATDDMARRFDALEKTLTAAQEKLNEVLTFSKGKVEDAMASTQAGIAYANPCIKARKCMLLPYKDTDKTAQGNGCCPGQTGHHVLPDAMFYNYAPATHPKTGQVSMKKAGQRDCWKKYKHGDAPTMCLEGTTNRATNGSHGLAHAATNEFIEDLRSSQDISYETASSEIAQRLGKPFGCNPACIKAQLDAYYKKVHGCGDLTGAQVTPHSGEPGGGPSIGSGDLE